TTAGAMPRKSLRRAGQVVATFPSVTSSPSLSSTAKLLSRSERSSPTVIPFAVSFAIAGHALLFAARYVTAWLTGLLIPSLPTPRERGSPFQPRPTVGAALGSCPARRPQGPRRLCGA